MIRCTECGRLHEDATGFCPCGAYLEWNSEPVADEEPEPAEREPPVDEPEVEPPADEASRDPGVVGRVRDLFGLDQQEAEVVAASPEVADAVTAAPDDGDETEDAAARARAEAAERAQRRATEAEEAQRRAEEELAEHEADLQRAREEAEAAEADRRAAEEHLAEVSAELEAAREAPTGSDGEGPDPTELEHRLAAAQAREEAEAERAEDLQARVREAEHRRREAAERVRERTEAARRVRGAAALVATPDATRDVASETGDGPARTGGSRTPTGAAPDTPAEGSPTPTERPPAAAEEPAAGPGPLKPTVPRPEESRRRRRQREEPSPEPRIRPGDLICGRCGTGNDPDRNFCRSCGNDLAEAEEAPEPGLWQRIRSRFRRDEEPHEAGERPMRQTAGGGGPGAAAKGRSAWRRVLGAWATIGKVLLAIAVLGGGIGLAMSPMRGDLTSWVGDRVDQIRGFVVPRYEPINAVGARATSETDGHPAADAVDLLNNTWWSTRPGQGRDAQLFVDFGGPVDVAKIGFLNGAAGEEEFLAHPRPREVHVVFSNGATADLTLEDTREFQVFDVEGATEVTEVELQILSVYSGQSGDRTSLTEVEFRTRK